MAFQVEQVNLGEVDEDDEQITSIVLVSTDYRAPQISGKGLGGNQKQTMTILRHLYNEQRLNLENSGHDPNGARVELGDWVIGELTGINMITQLD
ncbi:MAG: hypothetical protein AAES65_16430 [Candidatus Thiodiazotropha sp. (ex. Lucinoma kazani)]